jgi:hypothetical protein
MSMGGFLEGVIADRLGGRRASVPQALGAAVAIGAMAGVTAYRLLRSGAS